MEIRLSLQAREVLQALEQLNGVANGGLLYRWLAKIGLSIAGRDLETLLDRLECEGFVTTVSVEMRRVVNLTREGHEIASDVTRNDWIAPTFLPRRDGEWPKQRITDRFDN